MPHTLDGRMDSPKVPWRRSDIEAHLNGSQTFGHYVLSPDDQCKLFAFDIDLKKDNPKTGFRGSYVPNFGQSPSTVEFCDVREAWHNRKHSGRDWLKYQLKMTAHRLMAVIDKELELPCAAAYTGNKGVHVYAFTGTISADEAFDGAHIVLDALGEWSPTRGANFFEHANIDPLLGYPNLSIEVFPKQKSLDGKSLGNLLRLPLGKNLKNPKDPTFFLDMTSPMAVMAPLDPHFALTESAWRSPRD